MSPEPPPGPPPDPQGPHPPPPAQNPPPPSGTPGYDATTSYPVAGSSDPTRVSGPAHDRPAHGAQPYGGSAHGGPAGYGSQPYGAQSYGGAPAGAPSGPPGPAPGAPAGAGSGGGYRRRSPLRILGRALVVLLVVGAIGGSLAWGFTNRSSAQQWKERSERADADLRRSLDRIEGTTAELEAANDRARELANEKAGETDRNRILSEVVNQAPIVTDDLAECQQLTTELANDLIAATNDPDADQAALQRRIDSVNDICADALRAAEALEETIDALDVE